MPYIGSKPAALIKPAVLRAAQEMDAAEQCDDFENAEIVCDGRECWLGLRKVSRTTVLAMLRLCLLRDSSDTKSIERYTLNEEGRRLAKNPQYIPRIVGIIRDGKGPSID